MGSRRAHDGEPYPVAIGSDELEATFVPGAGMVCSSLRHQGAELLAQRGGVAAYAERGATMGIPLLYPWANRLGGDSYAALGRQVELPHTTPPLKFDANGLPIHGVLPSCVRWELLEHERRELRAQLRWESPELLAIFPYPHVLELSACVEGAALTLATSVRAGVGQAVPLAFGHHPYLTIPGSARETWQVELPVSERLLLDRRMIPTGASEPFGARRFVLGEGDWDDAFAGLADPPVFAFAGAARRVELRFLDGYTHAQVYTPAGEQFICFEPTTAPTNALRSGDALRSVEPGDMFRASFSISIA